MGHDVARDQQLSSSHGPRADRTRGRDEDEHKDEGDREDDTSAGGERLTRCGGGTARTGVYVRVSCGRWVDRL